MMYIYTSLFTRKKLIASIQQRVSQKSITKSIKKLHDIVTIIHSAYRTFVHGGPEKVIMLIAAITLSSADQF